MKSKYVRIFNKKILILQWHWRNADPKYVKKSKPYVSTFHICCLRCRFHPRMLCLSCPKRHQRKTEGGEGLKSHLWADFSSFESPIKTSLNILVWKLLNYTLFPPKNANSFFMIINVVVLVQEVVWGLPGGLSACRRSDRQGQSTL